MKEPNFVLRRLTKNKKVTNQKSVLAAVFDEMSNENISNLYNEIDKNNKISKHFDLVSQENSKLSINCSRFC